MIGGTSSNTSGVWSVGTSVSADGTYPVSADAVDTAGNASPYSSALSVTVDTVPPTGLITNPTAGSFVSGTVPISAVGSDNLPGLWKVTIQVDGVVKSTLTTSPYVYNWPSSLVANGSHTLGATIYDVAGNSYTTTIPITVQNGGTTTAPGAPTLTSATAGNGSVALTWNAPASNGGATLTGYTAIASPGGATCTASGTGTGCTVGGLTNGTSYSFTVTATNSVGTGPASNALSAIPSGTPGAPTLSTATRSVGSVTLGWSAPTSDGGSPITNYTVTASPGGATCNSSGLSCTVGGLAAGTS